MGRFCLIDRYACMNNELYCGLRNIQMANYTYWVSRLLELGEFGGDLYDFSECSMELGWHVKYSLRHAWVFSRLAFWIFLNKR